MAGGVLPLPQFQLQRPEVVSANVQNVQPTAPVLASLLPALAQTASTIHGMVTESPEVTYQKDALKSQDVARFQTLVADPTLSRAQRMDLKARGAAQAEASGNDTLKAVVNAFDAEGGTSLAAQNAQNTFDAGQSALNAAYPQQAQSTPEDGSTPPSPSSGKPTVQQWLDTEVNPPQPTQIDPAQAAPPDPQQQTAEANRLRNEQLFPAQKLGDANGSPGPQPTAVQLPQFSPAVWDYSEKTGIPPEQLSERQDGSVFPKGQAGVSAVISGALPLGVLIPSNPQPPVNPSMRAAAAQKLQMAEQGTEQSAAQVQRIVRATSYYNAQLNRSQGKPLDGLTMAGLAANEADAQNIAESWKRAAGAQTPQNLIPIANDLAFLMSNPSTYKAEIGKNPAYWGQFFDNLNGKHLSSDEQVAVVNMADKLARNVNASQMLTENVAQHLKEYNLAVKDNTLKGKQIDLQGRALGVHQTQAETQRMRAQTELQKLQEQQHPTAGGVADSTVHRNNATAAAATQRAQTLAAHYKQQSDKFVQDVNNPSYQQALAAGGLSTAKRADTRRGIDSYSGYFAAQKQMFNEANKNLRELQAFAHDPTKLASDPALPQKLSEASRQVDEIRKGLLASAQQMGQTSPQARFENFYISHIRSTARLKGQRLVYTAPSPAFTQTLKGLSTTPTAYPRDENGFVQQVVKQGVKDPTEIRSLWEAMQATP